MRNDRHICSVGDQQLTSNPSTRNLQCTMYRHDAASYGVIDRAGSSRVDF